MGYMLNEEQQSIVQMAHDFCEKEIKPYAADWDREGNFPLETVKKAMEIGYHCLEIPEEYGGSGIGLSIVKAIMEGLHQQYGVKNYDNGVEFWFTLDKKNQ